MSNFDPGKPRTSGLMLEDDIGETLPPELQRAGSIWNAVYLAVRHADQGAAATDITDRAMVELATVIGPLLPSNPDCTILPVLNLTPLP